MWALVSVFVESTNGGSILLYPDLSSMSAPTETIICCWDFLPLTSPLLQPEIALALGPSLVKQRGVKRSPENAWKNTCSFLSVIYSVHKVSDSPFKRCKSPRKAVLNDLHLIFMIHMAFHPKCQKWKKKTSYPYGSIGRQHNNLICNQTSFQVYEMTRIWYIQGWKPVFLFALKLETFTWTSERS